MCLLAWNTMFIMRKKSPKSSLSITKVFKLIGLPTYYLFRLGMIGLLNYLHLLKLFIQQLKRFFFNLSHILKIRKVKPRSKAKPRRHAPINFRLRPGLLFWILLPCTLVVGFYFYILRDLPSVKLLAQNQPSLSTKIYDRHGELLYQIYKDENRSLIKLTDLPKHVVDSVLAAEDKNFYHHFGVDPTGILRATYKNFVNCKLGFENCSPEGGSTITQQLIKNTLLSPEKTLVRKLKELILAIQTEHVYSKDQILEMYLNQVGYGGTAYGIEEASRNYFGKSAKDLTLAETAMLAGLPISPTILSPFGTNPYLGKIRQQQVLENMVASGYILEDDKVKALNTPLVFHPQGISIRAPHFVMYVKDLLVKQYGESVVARGGLSVTTTLDLGIQDTLATSINEELDKLRNLHVQNGAGMVVNPQSGEILAMVGSRDFFDTQNDGQVNVVLQKRQPGSSIKPITYALALERGLSPSSTIDDSPICYRSPAQPDYCPKNYDGRFHGTVTLRTALASSYNIPAVKLLNAYGLKDMIALAKRLGITTWEDPSRYGLSLTLGGGEITMLDLAGVYSVFANQGTKAPFKSILSVHGPTGSDLAGRSQPADSAVEVLSPTIAYQISSILSDSAARAPAFGTNSVLNLPGKNVAVKTGTTNSMRDNWTFGYTSDLLVATWVGNNDNTPMSAVASGITGASPIWAKTMTKLLANSPTTPLVPPSNLLKARVSCDEPARYDYFIAGKVPKLDCSQKIGTLLEKAAATSQ